MRSFTKPVRSPSGEPHLNKRMGIKALVLLPAAIVMGAGFQSKPKTPVYADVAPIFAANCVVCHRGSRPAHGLDLTTYAKIMKGDREGKVVVPKNPGKSRLATVLQGRPQAMPPGRDLKESEIAKIEAWIRAGAKAK